MPAYEPGDAGFLVYADDGGVTSLREACPTRSGDYWVEGEWPIDLTDHRV
jgi:hypothetical protein